MLTPSQMLRLSPSEGDLFCGMTPYAIAAQLLNGCKTPKQMLSTMQALVMALGIQKEKSNGRKAV